MKPEILLKAYVVYRSEDAFRELVAVFLDEVYSRALRIADGVSPLAEETALRVFWDLARKTPRLGEEEVLASWLRKHTCKMAVVVLRENGRSASRLTVKRERQEISTSERAGEAPPGLATRVCQGVLLNAARHKSFRPVLLVPAWIRPRHFRTAAISFCVIVVLWNIPFHRTHPIIQSVGVQMTPASFAQLGGSDDGDAPASAPPSVQANANPKPNPGQP